MPASRAQPQAVSAWRSLSAHVLFWTTVVVMLAVDLGSKSWVFCHLKPQEVRTVIPGVIEFRRSLNDGAVFGSFTGQVSVFMVASLFALAFVLYLYIHSQARQRVLHVALAMILAGALGNLYDRAFMIADVVRIRDESGRTRSIVGTLVGDPSAGQVALGDWPEGTSPRTFDRDAVEVSRQGVVRDFIKFVPAFPRSVPRLGGFDVWPWIFNVADASLVCGVILLLLTSLFERRPVESIEA